MKTLIAILIDVILFGCCAEGARSAETVDLEAKLKQATAKATDEKYTLQYKLAPGEKYSYQIEQLATVDTTIAGNNQKSKLTTRSVRSLVVKDVNVDGQMTFDHVIDTVDLWSEVTGRQAVRYNSQTDKEAPAEFESVAGFVGKPISTISIDSAGTVVKRTDLVQQANLGMGGITIPLPQKPIAIGHKWYFPAEIRVRLEDQRYKTVKTREQYELLRVSAGVATISIKTQAITPINDAKVKAQLIQRLSSGEIRFDIDAGRLISKRLDWDDNVLGFNGPDSNMKYLARFTEELLPEEKETARRTIAQPLNK